MCNVGRRLWLNWLEKLSITTNGLLFAPLSLLSSCMEQIHPVAFSITASDSSCSSRHQYCLLARVPHHCYQQLYQVNTTTHDCALSTCRSGGASLMQNSHNAPHTTGHGARQLERQSPAPRQHGLRSKYVMKPSLQQNLQLHLHFPSLALLWVLLAGTWSLVLVTITCCPNLLVHCESLSNLENTVRKSNTTSKDMHILTDAAKPNTNKSLDGQDSYIAYYRPSM